MAEKNNSEEWYEESYGSSGFNAQRLYPNEELLRFFGRNYFFLSAAKRKDTKVLEIGCGSCSNLWMIDHEGFDAHGIDLSSQGIKLGNKMLENWGGQAKLRVANMTDLPYQDIFFDVVVDVFSSYCLNESEFDLCLSEVQRVLKPGGRFFTYTPGKRSDAFLNHCPAKLIDNSTLSGIYREGSPFEGNHYPFRFVDSEQYKSCIEKFGFQVDYLESVQRSYFHQNEIFEHVVAEGVKL